MVAIRTRPTWPAILLKDRCDPAKHFINDSVGDALQSSAPSGPEIKRSWLVAAYDASGLCAGTHQGDRKAGGPGETPDSCDRQHDGYAGQSVELSGRDHKHWPLALLLMPGGWIEGDDIDIPTLHQISSRPAGLPATQLRSERKRFPDRLDWLISSSSV